MATIATPSGVPMVLRELTLRGIILGAIITLLFTAANVYLGLKIGLTFATSIPAAVISMAVLRYFSGATIQENNIVQTIASAAGTLSAIIFVLPGLVMVGWWTGFPVLAVGRGDRLGRHLGRDVFGAAAPCARHRVRPALSRRRRRRRSAQSRRRRRRGRGESQGPRRDRDELAGGGRLTQFLLRPNWLPPRPRPPSASARARRACRPACRWR